VREAGHKISYAPFRGLNLDTAGHNVPPGDCVDCTDVYVSDGAIKPRPGYDTGWRTTFTVQTPNRPIYPWSGMTAPYYLMSVLKMDPFDYVLTVGQSPEPASSATTTWWNLFDVGGSDVLVDSANVNNSGAYQPRSIATTQIADVEVFDNRIYMACGTAANSRKIYLDSSTWYAERVGVAAVTGASAAADSASSGFPGSVEYRYYISYYNSRTGAESPPVLAGSVTPTGTGEVVNVGAQKEVPTGTDIDSQVTHVRVYRQNVTGGEATAYLLGQSNTTVIAGSNTEWRYVDDGNTAPDYTTAVDLVDYTPPTSSTICSHKGRMWWAVFGTNLLRWSEIYEPEKVSPLNSFEFDSPVLAMHSAFGMLFVWTRHETHVITGDSPASFNVQRLHDRIGCVAKHSVVDLPNGDLMWVGHDFIVRFDGREFMDVSTADLGNWRNIIQSYNSTTQDQKDITAACWPEEGLVVFNGPSEPSRPTANYVQLVYHIDTGAWTKWEAPITAVAYLGDADDSHLMGIRPGGNFTGSVDDANHPVAFRSTLDKTGDTGATTSLIPYDWTTGNLDFGTRKPKRFYSIQERRQGTPGSSTVRVDASVDNEAMAEVGNSTNTTTAPYSVYKDFQRRGERVQLKVYGNKQEGDFKVTDLVLEGEVVGHR
jgi:hypothetical protein